MEDFDIAAEKYDTHFVNSKIGSLQRSRVYGCLEPILENKLRVLELNCGTGEDAVWMTGRGCQVVATDISEEMLKVGRSKALLRGSDAEFKRMDLLNINSDGFHGKYDLIFSNFGGLNCIDKASFASVFAQANTLLDKGGKMALVIMPKFCLLETLYFMFKLSVSKAFRRWTSTFVLANVDGVDVKTWYYSPENVRKLAEPYFKVKKQKPIGLFLPPSYLEPFFSRHEYLLRLLAKAEAILGSTSFFSGISDHFYIELEKIDTK